MILPYSTKINNKPTYFPERILSGMLKQFESGNQAFKEVADYIYNYGDFANYHSVDCILKSVDEAKSKLHTIRHDEKNRWKPGTKIDFFINVRQPNMYRFAPVLPVVSTQKIEIEYTFNLSKDKITQIGQREDFHYPVVYIDGKWHNSDYQLQQLAQNDGFNTVEDFFEYFNDDYEGKIIHWTDLRY